MKKTKRKSNNQSNNSKKEFIYQKFIGQFSEKHNCVFTDDGMSIKVAENKPVDPDSIYCPPASDKDRVEIFVTSYEKDKPTGYISKVLSRFSVYNVGLVESRNGNLYLQPFGTHFGGNILIAPGHENGALDGSIVTFMVNGKDEWGNYDVYVKDVFGHKNEANAFVKGVAVKYGLSTVFPEKAVKQVDEVPSYVREKDRQGRCDKRDLLTITIDGADTKDRDDAIRLEMLPNGNYLLGVDIADVDYYVPQGSPVDLEAKRRGTSCYAGGQVIPMLDKRLSNGICSLNEMEDRLALSCTMEFDKSGNLVSSKLEESVICVDYNMTYDEIMQIIDGDSETMSKYSDVLEMIENMRELANLMQKNSKKKGYLEFTGREAKLHIKDDKISEIEARSANEATKIIQSFMIAANISVALTLTNASYPCIYRIHDLPDEAKIDTLCMVLEELGYVGEYDSFKDPWKFFQNVINQVTGRDDEDYLMSLLKRTQRKAKYSSTNIGHFGIAEEHYCHFTSPIRRYPDLDVHRAVKAYIHDNTDVRGSLESMFEKDALSSSRAEVKADTVEREVEKIYKCIYIKDFVGQKFTGKISNIVKNGFYVELDNTIEGFVYVGGFAKCNFDEAKMTITDKKTSHKYRLGENVDIVVVDANEIQQTIDFALA